MSAKFPGGGGERESRVIFGRQSIWCEFKRPVMSSDGVQVEKSERGSLFGITRLCRVMPNSDPEGRIAD